MPTYTLHLHNGGKHPVVSELFDAPNDDEAKELASARLLSAVDYHYVTIEREGRLVGKYLRDSLRRRSEN